MPRLHCAILIIACCLPVPAHAQLSQLNELARMHQMGVTEKDLTRMTAKLDEALPFFRQTWWEIFAGSPAATSAPPVSAYRSAHSEGTCGDFPELNAFYRQGPSCRAPGAG